MKITTTTPEVQVHVECHEEPITVKVKGERAKARAIYLTFRDGKPSRAMANVDTPDGLTKMRNVKFTDLPDEVVEEIQSRYVETMLATPPCITVEEAV